MWQTLKEGSQYYAPFELSVVMNSRKTDVQRWLLNFDDTNVTSSELAVNNDNGSLDPNQFSINL